MAGLLSFLVNLMAAAWIKFAPTRVAPSATTGILGAALLYLGATHSRWAQHIFQRQPEGHVSLHSWPTHMHPAITLASRVLLWLLRPQHNFLGAALLDLGAIHSR